MEVNYKHRVVDALLERKLLGKGAVLSVFRDYGSERFASVRGPVGRRVVPL